MKTKHYRVRWCKNAAFSHGQERDAGTYCAEDLEELKVLVAEYHCRFNHRSFEYRRWLFWWRPLFVGSLPKARALRGTA